MYVSRSVFEMKFGVGFCQAVLITVAFICSEDFQVGDQRQAREIQTNLH